MYRWSGEVSIPKQEYWFLNKVLVVAPLISPLSLDLSRSLSFLSLWLSLSLDLALYKDLRSIIVKFQRIGLSPLIYSTALQTRPKMKEGPVHFISRSCFPNFFGLEKENSYLFTNISQILCICFFWENYNILILNMQKCVLFYTGKKFIIFSKIKYKKSSYLPY